MHGRNEQTCHDSDSISSIHGRCVGEGRCLCLRTGSGVTVTVGGDGCHARKTTLDLRPGSNYLPFPCEPVRFIRGVVLGAPSAGVNVRCIGDDRIHPDVDRLFSLSCPARFPAIEYQVGADGAWQSAAIVADEGEGERAGFVEIATR